MAAILVDNAEWLGTAGLLEFLRDVGKLLQRQRDGPQGLGPGPAGGREQSLSFTEFSYMLLQAWDFLQLYDRYHCELQLGGSDQWGNITEGVDLIRRRRGAPGLRAHVAAGDQGRRHEVRQDRGGQRVAGPGPDQPVRLLPVLAAHE